MEIADALDYAILNPLSSLEDIRNGCIFATKHKLKSVCVASGHVKLATKWHSNVCSVISFPHGNMSPNTKYNESYDAVIAGAKELDIVINYGRFLGGDSKIIEKELRPICSFCEELDIKVKAILEVCYYNKKQLIEACERCIKSGVDFVKTSTGFAENGSILDVKIMLDTVEGTGIHVKASGGIKTKKQANRLLDLGCTRLGSSRYPCE